MFVLDTSSSVHFVISGELALYDPCWPGRAQPKGALGKTLPTGAVRLGALGPGKYFGEAYVPPFPPSPPLGPTRITNQVTRPRVPVRSVEISTCACSIGRNIHGCLFDRSEYPRVPIRLVGKSGEPIRRGSLRGQEGVRRGSGGGQKIILDLR
eukprot:1094015-Prorocentrum_minimum.AAC.1